MIMYDTPSKHILDSIIILNIISFSWIGSQNMMDGVLISPESTYLAYVIISKRAQRNIKAQGPNTVKHQRTEELEVS